jgi:hypothetical protein
MIADKENLRLRFLRDPLPIRLGGLAATLSRISSTAREPLNPTVVRDALEEAKYLIEWTAADAEPEIAAELVTMQRLLNLWIRVWDKTNHLKEQRTLLSVQAKHWSDRALDFSGLAQ